MGASRRAFPLLATGVLLLAAVNAFYRLDAEFVTEWDESLYAISAWEMLNSGELIATTFRGEVDYYNTKPPLNTWLIALAFKHLGVNVFALRLFSAVCAWLSVLALLWWSRSKFGETAALLSALVLSTMFGFLYVHSGRTGNTDAAYALFVLLTVITVSAAEERPWRAVWLGPLLAASFLLRGPAVLLPLTFVAAIEIPRCVRSGRGRWLPLSLAAATALAFVVAWAVARWRFDGWDFFERMISDDLVRLSLEPTDGLGGSAFYYFDVLQKYQYDWLACAVIAAVVFLRVRPPSWASIVRTWRESRTVQLLACWGLATFLIPTAMATKTSWYLNPFYPFVALCIGVVLARSLAAAGAGSRRKAALIGLVAATALVAESRLAWRSWQQRDWRHSVQGVLMSEAQSLSGRTVYGDGWTNADRFVIRRLIGGEPMEIEDWEQSLSASDEDAYFVSSEEPLTDPRLELVRTVGAHTLYRREATCGRPPRADCAK